jgi:hypothetical protein
MKHTISVLCAFSVTRDVFKIPIQNANTNLIQKQENAPELLAMSAFPNLFIPSLHALYILQR